MFSSDPRREWFLFTEEKESGPYLEAEIIKLMRAHESFRGEPMFIFTDDCEDWLDAWEVPHLAQAYAEDEDV